MSALPLIADICRCRLDVYYVPLADIAQKPTREGGGANRTAKYGWASAPDSSHLLATEEILQKLPSNIFGIDLLLILRGFRGGRRAVVSCGRRFAFGLDLRSG